MSARTETLSAMVRGRAATDGEKIAYTFLVNGADETRSLTWGQLHHLARARANVLRAHEAAGQPVLLALPSGLEFIEWLFACWYAGAIAVPVSLPRHQRASQRLNCLIADARARLAVGDADVQKRIASPSSPGLSWINSNAIDEQTDCAMADAVNGPAIIQYTSGSTGTPRGVVVSHQNLYCNSAIIAEACGHGPDDSMGGWLPLFHDMGLVGVLQAAFTGARCVFMSPERFLMRPYTWLQMITAYKLCSSPAPNFAYDLCVAKVTEEQKQGFDLSGWRNALNGSEPIRRATLDRFANAFASCGFTSRAFFPCYGLAEATLLVTGRSGLRDVDVPGAAPSQVSCGKPYGDTAVAIVDPHDRLRLPDETIGEIWVAGASFAVGYYNDPSATADTFNCQLASSEPADSAHQWLRTGDMGMLSKGELVVTGRIKDLIIIAGRNLLPVDIEHTAEKSHPAIASFGAAAFAVDGNATERLIVLVELRREYARPAGGVRPIDSAAVKRQVRVAVAAEHDASPADVVILCPGALPRTTSGKLSRTEARAAYLAGTLEKFEEASHARACV